MTSAKEVFCPKCSAAPGVPCHPVPGGVQIRRGTFHLARHVLVEAGPDPVAVASRAFAEIIDTTMCVEGTQGKEYPPCDQGHGESCLPCQVKEIALRALAEMKR